MRKGQVEISTPVGVRVIKACTFTVYDWMRRQGRWVTSTEIIRGTATTTPSKRLDELDDVKLIEKGAFVGSSRLYRAVEVTT